MTRTRTATEEQTCAACGYDLRGIESDRCPECGAWFDPTGRLTPQLPWARRRGVRSYLKTVWRLTRRPAAVLADEMGRAASPVSAAWGFRRITILIAWVSVVAAGWEARRMWFVAHTIRASGVEPGDAENHVVGLLVWGWSFWLSAIALLLVMMGATACAGWVAVSRRLDDVRFNRALILAEYTCAPLAWTPVAIVLGAAMRVSIGWAERWLLMQTWHWWVLIGGPLAAVVALWVRAILALARSGGLTGWAKQGGIIVLLLLTSGAMALAIFIAIHAVSTFIVLLVRGWT
ncbi:MAG TPA: zf-TFIIB domain-containing protein [Tepidisphaeraceae bacterium]|jgi:hypothetical protein